MMRFLIAATAALMLTCGAARAQKPAEKSGANPAKPTQASLAAKGKSFGTIAATDAEVTGATKADDLAAAKKQVGKSAAFVGNVAKVFTLKSNSIVLLNFAKDYKTALVGAVKAEDFAKFPDLKTLEGKRVLLTGKVIDFKGQPEVELTSPDGIKVIR